LGEEFLRILGGLQWGKSPMCGGPFYYGGFELWQEGVIVWNNFCGPFWGGNRGRGFFPRRGFLEKGGVTKQIGEKGGGDLHRGAI